MLLEKKIEKRKSLLYYLMFVGIMFLLPEHVEANEFIVKDGKAGAEIIIGKNPTRMQKLAAEELQHYIKKLSGAEVPVLNETGDAKIKIYIGKSKYTDKMGLKNSDLDSGAYRMVTGENFLVLMGNDTNFFMDKPGDGGPEYPAKRGDRIRASEAWTEKNGKMWSTPFVSYFKGYHKKLGLWMGDRHGSLNAVNDFLRSLGVRWYMPGDFGEYLPDITSIALPKNVKKTVRPDWDERYIMFYFNNPFMASVDEFKWQMRLGFSSNSKLYSGHGSDRLVKYNDYVKKNHLEFFAEYGGTRDTGKPCYSSKGLKKSALGFASLMYDTYGKDVVSMMPVDGYVSFCQCKRCIGKDTPERGFAGMMSDYVWGFMNELAADVAKKYPDKKILNFAYNTYLEPPLTIENFHPNLQVAICHHRNEFHNPKIKKIWIKRTEAFIEKTASKKIRLWEYYQTGDHVPKYYPHIISEDIKRLKGHVYGEMIESRRTSAKKLAEGQPDPCLATNHVNVWVTTRLWWDPDQDVDEMMAEYYKNFYGPAEKEMKDFIEHCEKTWFLMRSKYEPIERAFELIKLARQATGEDTIYTRRVQMVINYIEPLKDVLQKLKIGRSQNPVAVMKELDKPSIKLDGKLDEKVWQGLESYSLKALNKQTVVTQNTTFKMLYAGDSIYFAVRCEEEDMGGIDSPAIKDEDMQIFSGDSIEILLETPTVSYYQIAFDPKDNMMDIKRSGASIGKKGNIETKWESGIESAVFKGEGFWSVETKIPALGGNQDNLLPFFGVSGDKPTKEMPWYFNVCRIRSKRINNGSEVSAFSPTETSGFHNNIMKFGTLTP
jgi:hypothetical protein